MTTIEVLRQFCKNDSVFITNHAMERCRERGIAVKDANGKVIHICMSNEGEASKVITAYYPSLEKWNADFKTRKEVSK